LKAKSKQAITTTVLWPFSG